MGPKIPSRVWRSHLLIARGFDQGIVWDTLRPTDAGVLRSVGAQSDPTLLILHGTGLRTRMGTAGFSRSDFESLQACYGPRILAFEHRAVRHGLEKNAKDLVAQLQSLGSSLRLHVLGLSRGGLLARMLTEGWVRCGPNMKIEKLVFLSTPNEGSLSARWDRACPKEMKVWRQDVRRLLRAQSSQVEFSVYAEPQSLARHQTRGHKLRAWPLLNGTADQLPGSPWLQRLNGFSGPSGFAIQAGACTYYGLASVFSFEHGAPNRQSRSTSSWKDIIDTVFSSTPNDLVVPTAGVYQPAQGPDACGRFPIPAQRVMVLEPKCNVTHIGMLWHPRVSCKVVSWLTSE